MGRRHKVTPAGTRCRFPSCGCRGACALYYPGWRDAYHMKPCPYCGMEMRTDCADRLPSWDHIEPRCKGGSSKPSNLVCVCYWCNQHKHYRTLEQWYDALKSQGHHEWAAHVGKFIASRKPQRTEAA